MGVLGGWRGVRAVEPRFILSGEVSVGRGLEVVDSILNNGTRAMGFRAFSGDEGNGFERGM